MVQVGYREVTLEDGIWIDLNLVTATPQHGLLLDRLVLTAQETLAALNCSVIADSSSWNERVTVPASAP